MLPRSLLLGWAQAGGAGLPLRGGLLRVGICFSSFVRTPRAGLLLPPPCRRQQVSGIIFSLLSPAYLAWGNQGENCASFVPESPESRPSRLSCFLVHGSLVPGPAPGRCRCWQGSLGPRQGAAVMRLRGKEQGTAELLASASPLQLPWPLLLRIQGRSSKRQQFALEGERNRPQSGAFPLGPRQGLSTSPHGAADVWGRRREQRGHGGDGGERAPACSTQGSRCPHFPSA